MAESPVGGPPELPPDVPPEYADAYLRGYERAYAEAAGLAAAAPLPGQVLEPGAPEEGPPVVSEPPSRLDRLDQPDEEPPEPWRFEPPEDTDEPEPSRTWAFEPPQEPGADQVDAVAEPEDRAAEEDEPADTAEQEAVDPAADYSDDEADDEPGPVVPGFVLWEGRDEWYDEPPDVEGYPRWVMPFLAGCLIVLLFIAIYLLA